MNLEHFKNQLKNIIRDYQKSFNLYIYFSFVTHPPSILLLLIISHHLLPIHHLLLLLIQYLEYFPRSTPNRPVITLQQSLYQSLQTVPPLLLELDLVLALYERPIDALQYTLLYNFLVYLESGDQELQVLLYEVNLFLLVSLESVKLEHLDKTLTSFLYDSITTLYLTLVNIISQQLHTHIKVPKHFFNEFPNLSLPRLNHLIELCQYFMYYI